MNPLSKEEFLEKLKTDKDFNNRYGRKHITEGKMVLPPCHYGFQVYTRELSLEERLEYYFSKILKNKDLEDKARNHTDEQKLQYLAVANVPKRAISLMWNQRSVDTFLGLPFNIASYALLLIIIGKEVNMIPEELIGNLGDVHLYRNHINQAEEQIRRKPYQLPKILIKDHVDPKDFGSIIPILRPKDFILDGYESHPAIKAPLSN